MAREISEENSLLSHEEWDVYSHLSLAYNAFVRLEQLFPSDSADFARGINELKNLLMSRPVVRELATKGAYDPTPDVIVPDSGDERKVS